MHTWALAIDPAEPETLFAGTQPSAVFRSQDGGQRWEKLTMELAAECPAVVIPRVTALVVDPEEHRTIWVGIEGAHWVGGNRWDGACPRPAGPWRQEKVMAHQITGRLRWDTTHAATPGWLLFLEEPPQDNLTMRPWLATSLPAEASAAEVQHLIADLLQRDTGQRPAQVQLTQRTDGPGYTFVATYEDAA
jgi:hypothetical protein